jgi:hypothetical protein
MQAVFVENGKKNAKPDLGARDFVIASGALVARHRAWNQDFGLR